MYKARPLVLALTGGKCWKNTNYFTQTLLPQYQREHPEETADWDVVYDARGHFTEPHSRVSLDMGTVNVRGYVRSWCEASAYKEGTPKVVASELHYPTTGPANRYKFALFIEKEGFDALLQASQIAKRYDLAIFSSKGQSTTATRQLVDALSQAGVTILVVHDFDFAGLAIAHILGHDTKRYSFDCEPNVIDLGLRLSDVQEMKLQDGEPFEFHQTKNPGEKLREYGATDEEIAFLVEKHTPHKKHKWEGRRVELNAMSPGQFIDWLERRLKEAGVTKLVPKQKTLADAWLRALDQIKFAAAVRKIKLQPDAKGMPRDTAKQLRNLLTSAPELSWDEAVNLLAEEHKD